MMIGTFVDAAHVRCSLTRDEALCATSRLLEIVKARVRHNDYDALRAVWPEIDAIDAQRRSTGPSRTTVLNGVSGLIGREAGGVMETIAALRDCGLSRESGEFVGLFVDSLRFRAGDELSERILERLPHFKALAL